MPSSVRLTFTDLYEYQSSISSSGVRVVLTRRGEFQAKLTRIALHRVHVASGSQSVASVAHIAVPTNRNVFFFLEPEDLAAFGRALVGREVRLPAVTQILRPSLGLASQLLSLQKAANDLATSDPD